MVKRNKKKINRNKQKINPNKQNINRNIQNINWNIQNINWNIQKETPENLESIERAKRIKKNGRKALLRMRLLSGIMG